MKIERQAADAVRNYGKSPTEDAATIDRINAQKAMLSSIQGSAPRVMAEIQTALTNVARDSAVVELAKGGKATDRVDRTEKIPSSLFDVKVSYVREGDDSEAVLKRQVELVPKSSDELSKSSDKRVAEIATDARFKPVLKEAVDAAVEQMKEPVNGFLSESEVKISADNTAVPVEADLGTKGAALTAAAGEAEKEVSEELKDLKTAARREKEDKDVEAEKQRSVLAYSKWASENSDAAKKLAEDECGRAKKLMELNPKLGFDMLDEETRDSCKELAKNEGTRLERAVLNIDETTKDSGQNAQRSPANVPQEQQRQLAIQQFMQTVQACMQANNSATSSLEQIKNQIKPMYDAIEGYDQLEKSLRGSTIAQNILNLMMEKGISAQSAISRLEEDIEMLYPDTDAGNRKLRADWANELQELSGKLGYFVREYQMRSTQMAKATADTEAAKLRDLWLRSQNGDQGAAFDLNLRAQQGQSTDPAVAAQAAFDSVMRERNADPNHYKMMQYMEAVTAASDTLKSVYLTRYDRHKNQGSSTWIGSSLSSVSSTARQMLNSSPQLRSNPNVIVDGALSGSLSRTPATMGSVGTPAGTLRSTGAAAPVTTQPTQTIRQTTPTRTNNGGSSVFNH